MTRYQSDILWLGLILIALNIVVNISGFKTLIFGSGTTTNSNATKTPSNIMV